MACRSRCETRLAHTNVTTRSMQNEFCARPRRAKIDPKRGSYRFASCRGRRKTRLGHVAAGRDAATGCSLSVSSTIAAVHRSTAPNLRQEEALPTTFYKIPRTIRIFHPAARGFRSSLCMFLGGLCAPTRLAGPGKRRSTERVSLGKHGEGRSLLHFDGALWQHPKTDRVDYLSASPFLPNIHDDTGWMMVKDDEIKRLFCCDPTEDPVPAMRCLYETFNE
jgi:hypothetical protein